MPLVSAVSINPLADGRQSARALRVRRGVQILLREMGLATVPEMTLASGRRADLVALAPDGGIVIVEIKSSPEDMMADAKWPGYRDYCDRLFFATLPDVPQHLFPDDCGFIRADGHGAAIVADAPEHRLAPARRKAVTLRFARFAAERLLAAEWASGGQTAGP
ncbi:MmcB family DNA repair protein [Oceaniradius stylonematis]|uniref:MmcB family DNA repair protein n=1 Tax=Oceaniradius stylonematis TaxID=2184161 RepID=UPI003C7ADAC7